MDLQSQLNLACLPPVLIGNGELSLHFGWLLQKISEGHPGAPNVVAIPLLCDVHALVDEVDLEHIGAHILIELAAPLDLVLATALPHWVAALACDGGLGELVEIVVVEGKHVLLLDGFHVSVDLQIERLLNHNLDDLRIWLCTSPWLLTGQTLLKMPFLFQLLAFVVVFECLIKRLAGPHSVEKLANRLLDPVVPDVLRLETEVLIEHPV